MVRVREIWGDDVPTALGKILDSSANSRRISQPEREVLAKARDALEMLVLGGNDPGISSVIDHINTLSKIQAETGINMGDQITELSASIKPKAIMSDWDHMAIVQAYTIAAGPVKPSRGAGVKLAAKLDEEAFSNNGQR